MPFVATSTRERPSLILYKWSNDKHRALIDTISAAKRTEPLYGLEIELPWLWPYDQAQHDAFMNQLNEDLPFVWADKADGGGIEFECVPLSKKTLTKHLELFCARNDVLVGLTGANNGLHISCDPITNRYHQYKLAEWMHSRGNRDLITLIGQRQLTSYCEQCSNYPFKRDCSQKKSGLICQLLSKSSCVHFQAWRIEFRFFKPDLSSPDRILKGIDFCQAIIDYTRDCSISALDHESFLLWLADQWRYPHLKQYLKEKGKLE